jgi:hypothetical protein
VKKVKAENIFHLKSFLPLIKEISSYLPLSAEEGGEENAWQKMK